MKSSSKILILAIFLVFICCVSAASAAENDNVTASGDELAVEEVAADDVIDEQDTLASQEVGVDEKLAGDSSSEYVVWVGTNSTPNGQGTEDDPFPTLDLACNNYNAGEQKDKVTVNVLEGNYTIGSYLIFNTNNLNINASGSVILKNVYDNQKQSFGLSSSGNFTMSNVIVDASNYHPADPEYADNYWFTPFVGDEDNTITFNNCIFTGFEADKQILPNYAHNYNNDWVFNYCKFLSSNGEMFGEFGDFYDGGSVTFNYCVFSAEFKSIALYDCGSVIFDSCWLGHNNGYTSTFFMMASYRPGYYGEIGFDYRVDFLKDSLYANRHAVLDVSENYLGDNTYEIIGKLIWNDGTDDNIDKLGSMTVYLSADNGNIPSSTTLENGTFNVTYTSDSDYHEIVVVLDGQKIKLNNKINFTLNAPTITYGDNQNITVTFPTNVNGTVYVTVNNNTYPKYVDDQNNVTVPIDDILSKGIYPVQVSFAYDKNEYNVVSPASNSNYYTVEEIDNFGFNSTTISVFGINDYTFEVSSIDNVVVGDEKTLTITLPDDANGTITVYVNTKEFTAPVSGNTTTLTINGFVAGNNVINITYNDNVKYESKNIIKNVNASLKPTTLTATDVTTDYKVAKDLVVTLTDINGNLLSNKTINIVVGTINETLNTTADGKVSIDISNLDSDTYIATISFAGDELYNSSSTTATVVVREDVKTDISIPSLTAGKAATTTIKLPENATGNITVTIDGKITSVVNLTNGSATITIPELSAGKHDVVISYSGDGNYAAFSQNSTVTVKEQAKPTPAPATVKKAKQATKIVAKNKKFKAKTKVKKYTITLKTKAGKAVKKVQVTIKIGKKTFKAKTNNKGKATFKIKKLTKKGKYTATIKFKGNANYKAATKKVKITIKK